MRKNTLDESQSPIVDGANMAVSLCPMGLMLSEHRIIKWCNERFASLFGFVASELIGQNLAILYPSKDEFQRIGERGRRAMTEQGDYQDERLMRRRDGGLQWYRVHGRAQDLNDPFAQASWVFEPLAFGADVDRLSPREREVLAGVARGQTSKEAAKEMGISPRTVENLRAALRQHFGVKNVAELMSRVGGMPS